MKIKDIPRIDKFPSGKRIRDPLQILKGFEEIYLSVSHSTFADVQNLYFNYKALTLKEKRVLIPYVTRFLLPSNIVNDIMSLSVRDPDIDDIHHLLTHTLYVVEWLKNKGTFIPEVMDRINNYLNSVEIDNLSSCYETLLIENALSLGFRPKKIFITKFFFNHYLFLPYTFEVTDVRENLIFFSTHRIDYLKIALEKELIQDKFFLPLPFIESDRLNVIAQGIQKQIFRPEENFQPFIRYLSLEEKKEDIETLLIFYPHLENFRIVNVLLYLNEQVSSSFYLYFRKFFLLEELECQHNLMVLSKKVLEEGRYETYQSIEKDIENKSNHLSYIINSIFSFEDDSNQRKLIYLEPYLKNRAEKIDLEINLYLISDLELLKLFLVLNLQTYHQLNFIVDLEDDDPKTIEIGDIYQEFSFSRNQRLYTDEVIRWMAKYNPVSQLLTYLVCFSDERNFFDLTLDNHNHSVIKWFKLVSRLPFYLQMRICQLVYGKNPDHFISGIEIDYWLGRLFSQSSLEGGNKEI